VEEEEKEEEEVEEVVVVKEENVPLSMVLHARTPARIAKHHDTHMAHFLAIGWLGSRA